MRSIRRSLLIYFLSLMAVALGAVGLLIDNVAGKTLAAREVAAGKLIDRQYEEHAREEREKFDADLNTTANRIANDLQLQYFQLFQKEYEQFVLQMRHAPLGSLAVGLSPIPLAAPMWAQIGGPTRQNNSALARLNEALARQHFSRLHLEYLPSFDVPDIDYVQVMVQAFPSNRLYYSRPLDDERWDISPARFDAAKLIDEIYDTRELKSGKTVRVVGLKSPITARLSLPFGRSLIAGPGSRGSRPEPRPEPPRDAPPPPPPPPQSPPPQVPFRTAFIEYGRTLEPLEARLAEWDRKRDEEKRAEAAASASDRRSLQHWLFAIGLITFAGLLGGGMFLVHRGLRPLNTLSDAVAKVSEKDFHLPVQRAQLSVELLPIHNRLTETLALLQKAFEHDKQAVADISHELRTPVAALLATLDVSLRKPRDAENYKQTLVECRGITKQLQGLVERVMTLASLDAAPATVATAHVDAVELAENCAAVIRPLAEAQGMSVTVNVPHAVFLRTDGDKLREVLLNLLHNAVEYNSPGGRVELSVSNGGPNAVFAVKDDGIGMTDAVKTRIFERFYRADPSRTATGIHAGLGLAIVKECVDRLGGTIRVQSSPGAGSEFTVELPA